MLTGVFAFGHMSGGHFNPAVTLGLAIAKRIEWKFVGPYMITQVVAATPPVPCSLLIAYGKAGFNAVESGFATNGYGDRSPGGYGLLACLVIEVVLTAVFLYIILGATDDRAPKGFARDRHRSGPDPDPPGLDPGDQHLGQPGPLARGGLVRRTVRRWPRSGCSSSRR